MASFLNCLACSSDSPVADSDDDVPTDFEIQYTTTVPSEFFHVASQQGTIELVEYDSKDYTSASRPTTHKPAYVYVPYGYDPSQKYDVIYLLHGWTGVAQEYFLGRSGNSRTGLVNIFDNLIQRGLCRPFIAVSPTWDKDNRSKDWGESTRGKYGYSAVGAVVGATYPEMLRELREKLPHTFFLVPGYGAQGGGAEDAKFAFDKNGIGAIVNSSRGIMCAWKKEQNATERDFAAAARREALRMRDDLRGVIGDMKAL